MQSVVRIYPDLYPLSLQFQRAFVQKDSIDPLGWPEDVETLHAPKFQQHRICLFSCLDIFFFVQSQPSQVVKGSS